MKAPSPAFFWACLGRVEEGRCSSSFLQGHPPSLRFGHPDVTFGRHRPSTHARLPEVARRVFRKRPQGVTRTLSDAERGEGGASGRRGPLRRRGENMRRAIPTSGARTNTAPQKRFSVRSYPAAHSREREPNAPRSAQPPASNQRQKQPQRCRCAPPARVRPSRQCR